MLHFRGFSYDIVLRNDLKDRGEHPINSSKFLTSRVLPEYWF